MAILAVDIPTLRKWRLTLQNRHRSGVILRVAQAEMNDPSGTLLQEFLTATVQNHKRLTAFLASHFHVLPAKLSANAGAEGLGNRLLGREARGTCSVNDIDT